MLISSTIVTNAIVVQGHLGTSILWPYIKKFTVAQHCTAATIVGRNLLPKLHEMTTTRLTRVNDHSNVSIVKRSSVPSRAEIVTISPTQVNGHSNVRFVTRNFTRDQPEIVTVSLTEVNGHTNVRFVKRNFSRKEPEIVISFPTPEKNLRTCLLGHKLLRKFQTWFVKTDLIM